MCTSDLHNILPTYLLFNHNFVFLKVLIIIGIPNCESLAILVQSILCGSFLAMPSNAGMKPICCVLLVYVGMCGCANSCSLDICVNVRMCRRNCSPKEHSHTHKHTHTHKHLPSASSGGVRAKYSTTQLTAPCCVFLPSYG